MTTTIASVTTDDARQRVAVAVSTTGTSPVAFALERSRDGGSHWEQVRGDDPADWSRSAASGASRTVYDVEPYRGLPLHYRARAILADTTAETWSTLGGPVTITGDATYWWAHPITLPRLATNVEVHEQPDEIMPLAYGEEWAIGRADPLVTFGVRRSPSGSLRAMANTDAERQRVLAAFTPPEPIVVIAPQGHGWGDYGRRYVFVRTISPARVLYGQLAPTSPRSVDLPWQEVASPPVPVRTFGATLADIAAAFATLQDIANAFPTLDALAGWTPV